MKESGEGGGGGGGGVRSDGGCGDKDPSSKEEMSVWITEWDEWEREKGWETNEDRGSGRSDTCTCACTYM